MGNESVRTAGGGDGELDLPGVGRALWARKGWVLGSVLLCLAGSVAFVSLVKPRYTGEAKIFVETEENFLSRSPNVERPQSTDPDVVGSHVAVVMSRDLARQAIRKLGLKGNSEFDPRAGGESLFSVLSGGGSAGSEAAPEDRMLDNYYNNLLVFSLPKSRVVAVEFSARDPDLAARGANTIADLYIEMQSEARRQNARSASHALGLLVVEQRQKLAAAEDAAEKFRSRTGLMPGTSLQTLQGQQLAEVNSQVAAGRSAQAEAQAKARLLRDSLRSGRLNEVPDVAKDDLIRRVSEQRINLRTQLALESRTLGPEHPRTKDIVAQLATLESELRGLLEKTARTLENDSRIAGAKVENLLSAVEQQKKIVGGSGADEVRMRELDRDVRLMKDQLEATTARWQDATAREEAAATPGEARVISRAVAPQKATFPKKGPIIAISTVAGLVFSVFIVVAIELFSGRAYAVPPGSTPTPVNVGPRMSGARSMGSARGGAGRSPRAVATARLTEPRFQEDAEPEFDNQAPMRRFAQLRNGPGGDAPAPAFAPAQPAAHPGLPGLTDAQMMAIKALAAQVLTLDKQMAPESVSLIEPSAAPVQVSAPAPAAAPPPPAQAVEAPAPAPQPAPAPVQPAAAEEPMVVARPPRGIEPQVSPVYRDLAQQIAEQSEAGTGALVLVSGVGGPALAAEAALPLARALSNGGRAILVDFTGRASPLNRRAGLAELILGDVSFAQAIHRDPGSRLHLLNRGRAEVDFADGLDTVIEALSQTYDFVVFVGPGDEDFDLTGWLAPAMDYSFLACRGDANSPDGLELQEALEQGEAPDVSVLDLDAMRGHSRRRGGQAQNAA
ncbi:MAG: Lipopolysaccharide biosynthesis protein [Hyphomicrobiales bacterium]|nr:Lipopolysaccharide biosynthesis protein [Hyphomicrobiales bacterium]